MKPYEDQPQSFILKIWLEERLAEDGEARWRAHITHVPSQRRRYVERLDQVVDFIVPYLKGMGVRFTVGQRLRYWLHPPR